MKKTKFLVVSAAALGFRLWERHGRAEFWKRLSPRPARTVFPALTCPFQASFRTASPPASHGMVANGFFSRELRKALFWEQSSGLYRGPRIWEKFREAGGRVGQICWQNSLGEESDLILSPAPVHKHHGGMIQAFYSRPAGLYEDLCSRTGSRFNLFNYWGPFSSARSSRWICGAACELLKSGAAPDLLLVYLPHLDYALQKFGPESQQAAASFRDAELMMETLFAAAKLAGYEMLLLGDYAITPAEKAILPNRMLRDKGFFSTRTVRTMLYPDIWSSRAFAMADHQIAHIYASDASDIGEIERIFSGVVGIGAVHRNSAIGSANAGDLILEAAPGHWFAYRWWDSKSEAPDYAAHIDIHNKPGFDPCELFMSLWPPMSISQDESRVRGTHGSASSAEHDVFAGSTLDIGRCASIIEAAENLKGIISQ